MKSDIDVVKPSGIKALIKLIENNWALIQSSVEAADELASHCIGCEYIIGIFNNKGILIYYNISENLMDSSRDMNIYAGACWNEEQIGTNLVWTTLKSCQATISDESGTEISIPISGTGNSIWGAVYIWYVGSSESGNIYEKTIFAAKSIEDKLYQNSDKTLEDQHTFFSEIVHESRNALTACEGFVQFMLIKKMFNAEYLEIVLSELKRTISILNSYNIVSYPNREVESCSLNNCINEVCTMLYSKLTLREISLNLSLSEIPDIIIDSSRIKQILLNMIENSIDAIGKNGSITISTCCSDNKVTINIKDTGCGIDPSLKDKVFDPFFTTKSKGTGLGLHVCKTIIESYKGSIDLESTPGNGTAFAITFPVDEMSLSLNKKSQGEESQGDGRPC